MKTPITSIKGFVETLMDGAKDDPESADRFLGIIATQAERLNAIIEDLLTLSRIEQEEEEGEIPLKDTPLKEVLVSAMQACTLKNEAKNITLQFSCPQELRANMNPPLLEQAVINLIDNAVKYSKPESTVFISGKRSDTEVSITVKDHGCGIEQEHLARLFERFYRVDKARSRKLGGTGLGLAIVKHIAGAHKGRVSVESTLGEGSVFSLFLPLS
ncbi:MAG: sensor histidine kinase [bacterium]